MAKSVRGRATVLAMAAALTWGCGDDDNKGGGPSLDAGSADGGLDASRPDSGPARLSDGNVGTPQDDGGGTDSGMVAACDATQAPTIPALKVQAVAGIMGLTRIVYAAQAPGSDDWYLVQQTGTIHQLSGGALVATPFLDVSSQVDQNLDLQDERGLLSLAFAPDYATSKKFYVVLTATKASDGFPINSDSVIEYQAQASGAPMRLRTLVQLPPSETNHNGGTVLFGPDGFLYYGTGDGGAGCNNNDEHGEAQSVATDKLHGKILRLDPKQTDAPYAAVGNPFAGMAGDDARVWQYGLRNPFRFSFDKQTGDLYIGDVGQMDYEEADFAPAGTSGLDFGWPASEGLHEGTCGTDAAHALRTGAVWTKPIVDIPRQMGAPPPFGDYISIIGGYVYRGTAIPQLQGVYLFGDYEGARFGALRQCGSTTSPITPIAKNKDPNQPNQAAFAKDANAANFSVLTGIVQGNDGELYFVANRSSLLKLVPGS